MIGRMHRRAVRLISGVVAVLFLSGAATLSDEFAAIGRSIDLFGNIFRELVFNYVDSLDADRLVRAGIRGMLAAVDPFTTFVDKEDRADVDMITTGSYGGIGITVSDRKGRHVVSGVIDTSVFGMYDIRIGDEIVRIDTTTVDGRTMDLKGLLRGRQGSQVTLHLRRPPLSMLHEVTILRRDVPVRSLALVTRFDDGIGYIKLDRFTRGAGSEMRQALESLAGSPGLRGIVLDLRDNPGGLLDEAVDVLEKIMPARSVLVSTRGRQERFTRSYVSEETPVDAIHPIIVLVNGASASASEIVAGAVQDHDRGVVLGTPTYGKGLVQTIVPVGAEASLKITSSKYYTPAGRCIQKPITPKDSKSQVVITSSDDTSRWFRTLRLGRTVFGSGGIAPDTVVRPDTVSHFVAQLLRDGVLFDFVTLHVNSAAPRAVPVVDDKMKRSFKRHLDTIAFDAHAEVHAAWETLRNTTRRHGYDQRTQQRLEELGGLLRRAHSGGVDNYWQEIRQQLELEFAQRFGGRTARLRVQHERDAQLLRARKLLQQSADIDNLLQSVR
jgi:carboxyl-terminal processing protease